MSSTASVTPTAHIVVYVDNGVTFQYTVSAVTTADLLPKVQEHVTAIGRGGYYHMGEGVVEFYPPHRILKVKATGVVVPSRLQDIPAVQAAGVTK